MIPKIIHYCWFGRGKKSELILRCIDSWKKYLPDYEIIEWNEDNFDVNICRYTKEAYETKKWAFVSDYARLYALYNVGGIYVDTDVEVLKSFDCFLNNKAFTGFESNDMLVTAVIGSECGFSLWKQILDKYDEMCFIKEDGSLDTLPNPYIVSDIVIANGLKKNGKLQTIVDLTVYPSIVFCPNNLSRVWNSPSKKSYAIHHFDQSWVDNKKKTMTFSGRLRRYLIGKLRNSIGTANTYNMKQNIIRRISGK